MFVGEFADSFAICLRVRQNNRNPQFVVNKFLEKFARQAATKIEKLLR